MNITVEHCEFCDGEGYIRVDEHGRKFRPPMQPIICDRIPCGECKGTGHVVKVSE